MSYSHGSITQNEQTQKSKRDNEQQIGKQDADKKSEEDKSYRDGKEKKEEESWRGKKGKLNNFHFILFFKLSVNLKVKCTKAN